jgi:hypothetical protein
MNRTVLARIVVLLVVGGLLSLAAAPAAGQPPGVYEGPLQGKDGTVMEDWRCSLDLRRAEGVLCPVRLGFLHLQEGKWVGERDYEGVYTEAFERGALVHRRIPLLQVTVKWTGEGFRAEGKLTAGGAVFRSVLLPSKAAPGALELEDPLPVAAVAGQGFMVKFAYAYRGEPNKSVWLAEEVTIADAKGQEPPVTCRETRHPDLPDGKRRMCPQYEVRGLQPGDYTIAVKVEKSPPGPTEEVTKQTALRVTGATVGGGGVLFTRGEPIVKRSAAAVNLYGLQYDNGATFLTYIWRDEDGFGWHNRLEWPVLPPTLQLGEELPLYLRVTRTDLAGIRASLVTESIVDETKLRVQSWPKSDQDQLERKTIRFQVAPGSDRAVIRVAAAVGKSPLVQVSQSDPLVQVTYEYRCLGGSPGAVPTGRPTIIDRTPDTEYETLPRGGTLRIEGAVPATGGEGVESSPGKQKTWVPVQPDQPLRAGDGLRTGPSGMAVLPLPDGAVAGLAPGTQVALTSAGLELVHGGVMVTRMGQPAGETAIVETSAARIRGLGTSYTVTHDPAAGMTTVQVHSGMVEVTPADPDAEAFILGSGERDTVQGPATTTPGAGGTGTGGGPGGIGGPAADFSGSWICDAAPFVGFTMVVSQDGSRASGYYDQPPGRIAFDGEVTGRVLRLRWRHTFDEVAGSGKLALSDDGQSFTGGWNSTADPDAPAEGPWTGKRGASFAGKWTCDAPPFLGFTMVVSQEGSRASGYYDQAPGRIAFEGEVTGRVLRLRWRHTFDEVSGSGKLTLSDNGESFTGGWNSTSDPEAPAEGSWIGRRVASGGPGPGPETEPGDFSGNWICDDQSSTDFPMLVRQDGNKVTGYHTPQAGKIEFDGEVTGRVLRLRWRHTFDAATGSAKLTLSEDGRSFTGGWNSTADPEAPAEGPWTGRRGASFAGNWTCDAPPFMGFTMVVQQDGSHVSGHYDQAPGRIAFEGEVTGRVLRLRWRHTFDELTGSGKLILSDDGESFTGGWNSTLDPETPAEGSWNGRRVGAGPTEPRLGFFAGLWTADDSYARYTMNLEQDGRRVTGTYDRFGGTLEGMVTGRTLTGTWRQPDNNRSGTLRLRLSRDGQAFEGTWTCPDGDPKEGPWTGRRVPLR